MDSYKWLPLLNQLCKSYLFCVCFEYTVHIHVFHVLTHGYMKGSVCVCMCIGRCWHHMSFLTSFYFVGLAHLCSQLFLRTHLNLLRMTGHRSFLDIMCVLRSNTIPHTLGANSLHLSRFYCYQKIYQETWFSSLNIVYFALNS